MQLINDFENSCDQSVRTFNKVFKYTPIVDVNLDLEVIILEPTHSDMRILKIGEEFVNFSLIQPKSEVRNKYMFHTPIKVEGKTCTKCKVLMPMDKFSPHKKSKEGRRAACKWCYNMMVKARRKLLSETR